MATFSATEGPTPPPGQPGLAQRGHPLGTGAIALGWGVALGLLLALYLLAQVRGQPLGDLTRDPAAITQSPPYTGVLSMVGVMLWAAAAAVSLLGAAVLHQGGAQGRHQKLLFLLASAGFSICLGLDDALMLHEQIFPNRFNWPETAIYLTYILAMVGYVTQFRQQISPVPRGLLAITCLCWGLSIGIDSLLVDGDWMTFVEDSFKFLGIVSWLMYCSRSVTGLLTVRRP